MCVNCKTLSEEELIACAHHTAIVQVNVIDEEPRADTVCLKRTFLFEQLHVVLVEEQACLVFGVSCHIVGRAVP